VRGAVSTLRVFVYAHAVTAGGRGRPRRRWTDVCRCCTWWTRSSRTCGSRTRRCLRARWGPSLKPHTHRRTRPCSAAWSACLPRGRGSGTTPLCTRSTRLCVEDSTPRPGRHHHPCRHSSSSSSARAGGTSRTGVGRRPRRHGPRLRRTRRRGRPSRWGGDPGPAVHCGGREINGRALPPFPPLRFHASFPPRTHTHAPMPSVGGTHGPAASSATAAAAARLWPPTPSGLCRASAPSAAVPPAGRLAGRAAPTRAL
jgi:hypothetical protein